MRLAQGAAPLPADNPKQAESPPKTARKRCPLPWLAGVVIAAMSGCGGTTTQLVVQITYDGPQPAPSSVSVAVLNPYGMIGQKEISPAPLPGELTVSGLPNTVDQVRIAAVGTGGGQRVLGATRVTLMPHQKTTVNLLLSAATTDKDGDGVPDAIDDCPMVADPMQTDANGMPPGDACNGGLFDLSLPSSGDLAPSSPDLLPSGSNCAAIAPTFCDGFEGTLLSPVWTQSLTGGTATIDATRAYRGKSSLHLHQNLTGSKGADIELNETQAFASHFWARVFVWVPAGFDPSDADILLVEQGANPYLGITLKLAGGGLVTEDLLTGGARLASTTTMPTDRWVCLEWEVQLGTAAMNNGSTALSVDGVAANGLGGAQPLWGGTNPINTFTLSLLALPGTPPRDLWMDELVIDTKPIGCAN